MARSPFVQALDPEPREHRLQRVSVIRQRVSPMMQDLAVRVGDPQPAVRTVPIRSADARTSTVSPDPTRYSTAFRLDEPTLIVGTRGGWPVVGTRDTPPLWPRRTAG